MTTSHHTVVPGTEAAAPTRRTTVVLAVLYCVLFVGIVATGGAEIASSSSGKEVIEEFTISETAMQISGYGLVVTAIVIVFWGAAMRARLTSRRLPSWTADAVLAGTVALALTLVGWTVTLFALKDAVDSGVPEVAQAANIMDNANFVPAMLGLACTMVGVGLTAMRDHSLPRWLAVGSIAVGAIAPLGPGGFVPFALFPIWAIAVSALLRTTHDA